MKAFFGALILSIASAAVGVFASAELHEMALAAGGAKAVLRATPENSTSQQSQPIKQLVDYPAEGAVPTLSSDSAGN